MSAVEDVLDRWVDRPGPLHRKLTEALREAVDQGRLAGGERLPSERDLARRLAVSRSTVVTAYDALRAEGVLQSRQGSGTRVRRLSERADHPIDTQVAINPVYRSLLHDNDGIISLAAAVLPADDSVPEAFAAFAAEDAEKLFTHIGYTPAGLPELRERIAEHLTDEGTPTTSDQIVVTTGAQQAVNLAALLLVQPCEEIIAESPSFAGTIDAFRTRGARIATVPVGDDGIDPADVVERLAQRRPAAVYLMPSFHNPTGAQLSRSRRRRMAELASAEKVAIIEDNALQYSPLDADVLPPIAAFADRDAPVLSAGSLSKAAWGGLRVGWVRGPARLASRLGELKGMSDLGSPLIDQAVATRIVPRLGELRERHRGTLLRHRRIMVDLLTTYLPDWRWNDPRGGTSLWVQLPQGDSGAFAQVALRHGVEVVPGQIMAPGGGHEDHFRLPFTHEPTVLEETTRRLAEAWRSYVAREELHDNRRAVIV